MSEAVEAIRQSEVGDAKQFFGCTDCGGKGAGAATHESLSWVLRSGLG